MILSKVKVKLLSRVQLFATPWTVACTRLLRPWDFLGKSSGVGWHFLKHFPIMPYPFLHCSFFTHCYRLNACSTLPYPPLIRYASVMVCGSVESLGGDYVMREEAPEWDSVQFSSVQSLSCVPLFATPWIAARQISLSITNSRSLLKLMPIESVMPSSHLIFCRPLLLLPPIPPRIRVFSNESTLLHEVAKVLEFQL